MNLLDLMRPVPKPIWRGGVPMTWAQAQPKQDGDLQWLAHDWQDHRKGGRWFRYDARDRISVCIDPYDQMGINQYSDHPPPLDGFGRMKGVAA